MIELIFSFLFTTAQAQDLNGYLSQYECRAGNGNCNVDIATLAQCTCDDTITDSMSNSTISSLLNDGDDCNCVDPGDYSFLDVTVTASGTSGTRKVIRLSGSATTDPWDLSVANQAVMKNLEIQGDYWVVHRLSFDTTGNQFQCLILDGSDNTIVNQILHEGCQYLQQGGTDNSGIQNSVLRDTDPPDNQDVHCAKFRNGDDQFFVNNEAYDCSDGIQIQDSGTGIDYVPGLVIENNDFYTTTALYCDSNGTPNINGLYSAAENGVDLKGGGSSSKPAYVKQNRFWGFRQTDQDCGSSGSSGQAIIIHQTGNDYVAVVNNIIFNSWSTGISFPNPDPERHSIIGNIFYNLQDNPSTDVWGLDFQDSDNVEAYLNTLIGIADHWARPSGTGHDIRCNVFIDAKTIDGSGGSGVQIDYNVYYNTTSASETNKIVKSLNTRNNSSSYSSGDLMRRTTNLNNCTSFNDPDCFMYVAQNSGTTASSEPTFCTTPNCIFQDGTVSWKSIRGPYQGYRKLNTSPELYVIAYSRPYMEAPEISPALFCPSTFPDRSGVGIDNSTP